MTDQKVKTPTGWNTTTGAYIKTDPSTWKAVDKINVKTPYWLGRGFWPVGYSATITRPGK